MNQTLKNAIREVEALPEAEQEELGQALLDMALRKKIDARLSAALERGGALLTTNSWPNCARVTVAEIRWLDQAKDDLRELLDFIARESPQAAENYVSGLQSACARLEQFPLSGRSYDQSIDLSQPHHFPRLR